MPRRAGDSVLYAHLDPKLHRQLRFASLALRRSVSAIAADAIRHWLQNQPAIRQALQEAAEEVLDDTSLDRAAGS